MLLPYSLWAHYKFLCISQAPFTSGDHDFRSAFIPPLLRSMILNCFNNQDAVVSNLQSSLHLDQVQVSGFFGDRAQQEPS